MKIKQKNILVLDDLLSKIKKKKDKNYKKHSNSNDEFKNYYKLDDLLYRNDYKYIRKKKFVKKRIIKKKVLLKDEINYKNIQSIKRFIIKSGKIARITTTKLELKQQKLIAAEIKKARIAALLSPKIIYITTKKDIKSKNKNSFANKDIISKNNNNIYNKKNIYVKENRLVKNKNINPIYDKNKK
uniref:Small ribosomal subunit protein bS18c n=1 Tax=Hydnora visseri TaxID=1329980 RepID=A0A0X9LR85_HYDVS|nr:ribosomal protein S18 [Hydnora visseri]ALZ49982.1 ribosomal protein S18 [Hydnora visseri]